jgi:hypothetical protein
MGPVAESTEHRLVLITGAGASVHFGADGRTLPLMADWSDALVKALDSAERGLATTIDLRTGLTGEEFEEVLGAFLRWNQTFDATKRFIEVGRTSPDIPITSEILNWLSVARQRARTIVQAVNVSLWQEFGLKRVDTAKATSTYQGLLKALRALPANGPAALFSATTNYDRLGEVVLDDLGFTVDTGTGTRPVRARTEHLDVDAIQPWADPMTVPHLHLHGAVGWYRDPQGGIWVDPADRAYDPRLTPAVLHPDPDKDPLGEGEVGVSALWNKFADALESATDVLVLGHSLHDPPLLDALFQHSGRNTRFAFTFHHDAEPIKERLKSYRTAVANRELSLISMDFQPKQDFRWVRAWIDGGLVREDGTVGGVPLRDIE